MENPLPITVEDICLLAASFVDQKQYDKAIQLYESACRMYPEHLALKINLGRVKALAAGSLNSPKDILSPNQARLEDLIQRAHEQLTHGHNEEAIKTLESAKLAFSQAYQPFYELGAFYLRQQSYTLAYLEFVQARHRNPFDLEVLSRLGEVSERVMEWSMAMECWVDALIISGGIQDPHSPYVVHIKRVMTLDPSQTHTKRNALIKERSKVIHTQLPLLRAQAQKPNQARVIIEEPAQPPPSEEVDPREGPLLDHLKQFLIFRNMEEQDLRRMARMAKELSVRQGDHVYHEGEPVQGLYFVGRGRIDLRKETPYGPLVISQFEKGSFFGDDSLLHGRHRNTGAYALTECDLYFIDKNDLAKLFAAEKRLAIHFLWYFWKSLSFQIREANHRMTDFFKASDTGTVPKFQRPTPIEFDKKMEVLQTKGLGPKDLAYIARLSMEEIYNAGETIFQEGDPGDRLYIVLEGSVLISKRIPNLGDETLTILNKGDFFGEMALAGLHVRSADAKAQSARTVLLVITRQALREILSIDVDSAYQFLLILCRILSQRLLEMNEKLYQWKMMSGAFISQESTAPTLAS